MRLMVFRGFICFLFFLVAQESMAQGRLEDYQRAMAIDSLFNGKVYNSPRTFQWLSDNQRFWYENPIKEGKEYVMVDIIEKKKQPAFDHQRLADTLSTHLGEEQKPYDLPLKDLAITDDGKSLDFKTEEISWHFNLVDYSFETKPLVKDEKEWEYWGNFFDETTCEAVISPDSLWTAFIKNSNVSIKDKKTGDEFQLSYDGSPGAYYSSYMKWSPDSKKLMAYKVLPGEDHKIFFVESSPKDQLQPKLCERDYRKPGDVVPQRLPQLFLIEEKKHVLIPDELLRNQFYLSEIEWRKDSRAFTFEFNQRGHQKYRIIEVQAPTGKVNILVDEKSETFIDYSGKRYRYDVSDGAEIIWASERDGWNHLYLYNGKDGKVKNQITKGEWVVRNVVHVDTLKRSIIFGASGLNKKIDPYLVQYCSINFDGSGFKILTKEDANHSAWFSDDFQYFIDSYSRVDLRQSIVLKKTEDGKEVMALEKADISDLEANGWSYPEVFNAKGRDGKTDIWGIIVRPSNFNPQNSYPIIEYIYAGPHSAHVPKSFRSYFWSMHALAELGFIVVQIDGMGTSLRSKAFHDVCWKNLKDAGFPDRIAWMKAAAKKYPYMDISRVGIHGVSAGGQNAAGALIFHPEFYKAAVSSCGCHDNRMDKIWWNEQWMGYPVGPHYAESSNIVNAEKLEGNLMLILGEVDDNVDPASTMQFADALIKANKNFELVVLPGFSHTGGGEYGERKRKDFFVKHLMQVDPPDWSEIYGKYKNQ